MQKGDGLLHLFRKGKGKTSLLQLCVEPELQAISVCSSQVVSEEALVPREPQLFVQGQGRLVINLCFQNDLSKTLVVKALLGIVVKTTITSPIPWPPSYES